MQLFEEQFPSSYDFESLERKVFIEKEMGSEEALDLEEDRMLGAIADERLKNHKGRWVTDNDKIWKQRA